MGRGQIAAHRNAMVEIYALVLVLTGAVTLLPGRTMHAALLGG